MADELKRWLDRLWFFRGVTAAIVLAQLVPSLTDLTRFEFLRAFHALLVSWSKIAAQIGVLVGHLPYVPRLSAETVNALLFCTAIGLPGAYQHARMEIRRFTAKIKSGTEDSKPDLDLFSSVLILISAFISYIVIIDWAESGINGAAFSRLAGNVFGDSPTGISNILNVGTPFTMIALTLFSFLGAFFELKSYRYGFVFVVTFVAAIEILYFFQAPWLADKINEIAESTLISD